MALELPEWCESCEAWKPPRHRCLADRIDDAVERAAKRIEDATHDISLHAALRAYREWLDGEQKRYRDMVRDDYPEGHYERSAAEFDRLIGPHLTHGE